MGYYIEQIENAYKTDWQDACIKGIDGAVTPMYDNFKTIIEENDFPSKAEERWTAMLDKIKTLSSEIKTEISAKYDDMMGRATQFQGWFDNLSALAGQNGYDWAKDKGFTTDYNETKEVIDYGPKAGNMDYSTYRTTYTYTWKSFDSVSINSDGYIEVTIGSYKRVKDSVNDKTSGSTSKVTVTNEAEYQSVINSR